ncbi:MAG TPA: MFS transporter [Methylomirabilota bacterium]|nr:MFS transporter [Methylomirabilota bacterium]
MTKQQRLVLIVSVLASFVAFLDGAIVNVALPAIQNDLGGGLSVQQWIVDAYLLTLGSLILIAGSLSDLLGRRKILKIGLWGFASASLLCALAPSSEFLIAARALQGAAGALLVPSSLALIIATFSGTAQAKAIGTWTAWTGIAFVLGPLVGGILVDSASWRWIFAINILPIAVTLYLLRGIEVAKHKPTGAKVDFIGAIACALGLGGVVYALIEQPHYGWLNPHILPPLIIGTILLIGFLIYEKRAKYPMLQLGLFKNRNFSVGNLATVSVYAGLTASLFLLVLFLQQVAGYSALAAGMASVPITIIMFIMSPRFGALSGKYGPRLFMGIGPIISGLGFLLLVNLGPHVNYWTQLLPTILIFGLGLSITVAPLTAAILGDVPPKQAGIASAVNNAVSRIAGLVAVAAVGAIVASQYGSVLEKQLVACMRSDAVADLRQSTLQVKPPAGKSYSHDPIILNAMSNASISAFHSGVFAVSALLISGGFISLIGIKNPVRKK